MSSRSLGLCAFCRKGEEEKKAGEMLTVPGENIMAHNNCMLFSPRVVSKDSESQDLFGGFNIESVKKEIDRARNLKCSQCKLTGASIGCDIKRCRRTYHYLCIKKAKGKRINDRRKEKYIAYCAKHKNTEQAIVANHDQSDDDTDTNDISDTLDNSHGKRGRKKKRRKQGTTNAVRNKKKKKEPYVTGYHSPVRFLRSVNQTQKEAKGCGVVQNAKTKEQSGNDHANHSEFKQSKEDNVEAPGTSRSARASSSSSESSDSLLSPRVIRTFSLSGINNKRKHIPNWTANPQNLQSLGSEEMNVCVQLYADLGGSCPSLSQEEYLTQEDQNVEEMAIDDKIYGNAVDHLVLEMTAEAQSTTKDDTVILNPSRSSPALKQCTMEESDSSSNKDPYSTPRIAENTNIVSRFRNRLITQPQSTSKINGRCQMMSLDGSLRSDNCIDGPAVQSTYLNVKDRPKTQPIDSVSGKDRLAILPTGSSNGIDRPVEQPVGSITGEDNPVTQPNLFKLDEKPEVSLNLSILLFEQPMHSSSINNTSNTLPPNSTESITQGTSQTCPSVSPLAQHLYAEQADPSLSGQDATLTQASFLLVKETSVEEPSQYFKLQTNPVSVDSLIPPDVRAPETEKEAPLPNIPRPQEMAARLGALSNQFIHFVPQIQSTINSSRKTIQHSRYDQATSEQSPRPGLSSEQTEKQFNEVDEKQRSSGQPHLKPCDGHCLCYSRLEEKFDSLLKGQERLLSLLEAQQRTISFVLGSGGSS
ncbi:uncharacterized protein LOC142141025 isoform X2 [Mixophyes fleayi]|uniref:uncharacterized protein LOC142141025 isoform X2 n=1 Tax=Mixophyes fleayi TaxID=3061075 RepID=UPI003F4D7D15